MIFFFWKTLFFYGFKENGFFDFKKTVFFKFLLKRYYKMTNIYDFFNFFFFLFKFKSYFSFKFYYFFFQLFLDFYKEYSYIFTLNHLLVKRYLNGFFKRRKKFKYLVKKKKYFQRYSKFFGNKMFINNFELSNCKNICVFNFMNNFNLKIQQKKVNISLVINSNQSFFFLRQFKTHNGCRLKKKRRL